MKGNGEFKWWTGVGGDHESFHGPYDSKEEAVAEGHGYDYVDGFTVVEADKSLVSNTIDGDDYAEQIVEELLDDNAECWGEDGPDDVWSPSQIDGLAADIRKTVDMWLMNNQPTTWTFGVQRNSEYFPPKGEKDPDQARDDRDDIARQD
jgi:hypothetical protein